MSSGEAGPASTPGLLEWFRPGEHEQVESALQDLRALGVTRLRTGISWADWLTPGGEEWYRWLIPRLAAQVELLPCALYTPPSLGVRPATSSPPRRCEDYADWLDRVVTLLGDHFEWIELWNEPANRSEWDHTLDPDWWSFCSMIGSAAYWMKKRGRKTLLAGMSPVDPHWLRMMFERGVMAHIDAVGIHGFPGIFDHDWTGWDQAVASTQKVLDEESHPAQIWITEAGYSTWRLDEWRQVVEFARILEAPAARIYWYAVGDLSPALPTLDGCRSDEREYHFGLRRHDGREKLLLRVWRSGGLDGVRRLAVSLEAAAPAEPAEVLITGGAGRLGVALAGRLLDSGRQVMLMDNLSRPGSEENWLRLQAQGQGRVSLLPVDLRDRALVRRSLPPAETVYHLARPDPAEPGSGAMMAMSLLDTLCERRPPPPVVCVTSAGVLGARRAGDPPLDEEAPIDPPGELIELALAEACLLWRARADALPVTVLRAAETMGASEPDYSAAATRTGRKSSCDSGPAPGLLPVDDLVTALLLAAANMEILAGGLYHVGPAADSDSARAGSAPNSVETPEPRVLPAAAGLPASPALDSSRFRSLTGWAPASLDPDSETDRR